MLTGWQLVALIDILLTIAGMLWSPKLAFVIYLIPVLVYVDYIIIMTSYMAKFLRVITSFSPLFYLYKDPFINNLL